MAMLTGRSSPEKRNAVINPYSVFFTSKHQYLAQASFFQSPELFVAGRRRHQEALFPLRLQHHLLAALRSLVRDSAIHHRHPHFRTSVNH